MTKMNKIRPWIVIKTVILSSAIVSRAVAAIVPPTPDHTQMVDVWRSVGDDLNGRQTDQVELNEYVVDMIVAADLEQDLSAVVMATYALVDPSQVAVLDNHWTNVLMARDDAALVTQYLSLRSGISDFGGQSTGVEALIWKANHGGNHGGNCDGCNSGNGNGSESNGGGSDCDPGNSGGNNNGGD